MTILPMVDLLCVIEISGITFLDVLTGKIFPYCKTWNKEKHEDQLDGVKVSCSFRYFGCPTHKARASFFFQQVCSGGGF